MEISNHDDLIDVRDVIARIEHLEQLRQPGPVDLGADDNEQDQDSLFSELAALEKFLEEMKGYGGDVQHKGNWYPGTAIRDDFFIHYAMDLADDIGAIENSTTWPATCIDWDKAARELQTDYTTVEFDGATYWVR